ncbi:MAG: hypothetical protein NTZ24_06265 [Deltaproteobacteria bacterium]|nr:hypothetical protein [Deltaproteobacteria bacterium]
MFLLLGACASPMIPPGSVSPLPTSDADLFRGGLSYMGSNGQPADYGKARSAFDTLVNTYPKSRWRGSSEMLIRLIDECQSCQEQNLLGNKTQSDKNKLLQENERLKKDIRQLQSETARLSQENEQLKNDIQLLKNLEIQLDKREKMYR